MPIRTVSIIFWAVHMRTQKEKMALENQVGPQVPKTFIWNTFSDETVPFWNSMRFVEALGRAKIPVEFHLYPEGPHRLSLATESMQKTRRQWRRKRMPELDAIIAGLA